MRQTLVVGAAASMALAVVPPSTADAPTDSTASHERILGQTYGDEQWQGRVLWLDLAANLERLDSRGEVRDVMRKAADVGFDTVVVDVKNYTGFVAYDSDLAPHLSTTSIPSYQGYPAGYDLLQTAVEAGHARDLEVIAATNTFSEGATAHQDGPAFEHPEWQTQYLAARRMVEASDGARRELTGVDVTRAADALVAYTPATHDESPANQWGVEAQVVDGQVMKLVDRTTGAPPLAVPDGGYVLSGHGTAADWMRAHLAVGATITVAAESDIVPAARHSSFATFVNPILPDVREYELAVLREIAEQYDVDGISLDRARYSDVHADFSDESRAAFEEYLGHPVDTWPADVMSLELDGFTTRRVEGPLFEKWIEWRARVVQQFVQRAEREIHGIDHTLHFTDYVGAWYPLYYEEGVNWGSRDVQPDYDWAGPDYGSTGYAEDMDFLMVGTYFEDVTEAEAIDAGRPASWYSVEGSAELAVEAVDEATWVYSSLYLLQYRDDPERFRAALDMGLSRTHGIMIFDLVYLEKYGWWHIVEDVFDESGNTREPHTNPGWTRLLRADR